MDGFLGFYVEDDEARSLGPGSVVFLHDRPYEVREIRRVDRGYQIAFVDVDDRSGAEEIRGMDVMAETRRDLAEGEYWPGDLIGLDARDEEGKTVGRVVDVLFGAAQERLLIETPSGDGFEVPFVGDLVPVVDLEQAYLVVVAIPGLIEPSG